MKNRAFSDEPLAAEMAQMRQEMTALLQQVKALKGEQGIAPEPVTPMMTSRRQALRRLAGALVAGVAATVATGGLTAQARMVADPSSASGRVGAIIVPRGTSTPAGTPPVINNANYGLVATDGSDSSFDLTKLFDLGMGVYGNGYYYGLFGYSKNGYGVYGQGNNSHGTGVFGSGDTGVYGGGGTYGIYGSSNLYAVYGFSASGYGGYFHGDAAVTGSLSKGGGSFKIDHPLDPANKYLYHSFVESPDMKNIYDGVVTLDAQGEAVVELPGWFESLNFDFRYQLTALGQSSPDLFIAEEVKAGRFKIAGGKAGQRVSWQLTGIRQDKWANAHRIPVEEQKPAGEKGLYLHPELYGQPPEKGISHPSRPKE